MKGLLDWSRWMALVGMLSVITLSGCSRFGSSASPSSDTAKSEPPMSIVVRGGNETLKIDGRNPAAPIRMVLETEGGVREVKSAVQYSRVVLPNGRPLIDPTRNHWAPSVSKAGRTYPGEIEFVLNESAVDAGFVISLQIPSPPPGKYRISAPELNFLICAVGQGSAPQTQLAPGQEVIFEAQGEEPLFIMLLAPHQNWRPIADFGAQYVWPTDPTNVPIRGLIRQVQRLLSLSETPSPFAGTDTRFQNHVFWDADVWMFPAVVIFDTELATKIFDYRVDRIAAARKNFAQWREAGYPTVNKTKHTPLPELTKLLPGVVPAMFPWESKLDGSEGSPSDTVHQHHVTAAVGLMAIQAELHGIGSAGERRELLAGCAAFYLHRLARNPDGTYGILHTLSPSEWHTASNDLYTNAAADVILRHVLGPEKWPLGKMKLPRRADAGTFATFDEDTHKEYQQAAALLAIWPARHPSVTPESSKMLEFYRGKTSEFGPAMSHSLHSLIAARQGRVDLAWEEFEKSWRPYSGDVSAEFREKPNSAASYFVTGAAGVLNAFFYGFLGFDVSFEEPMTRKLRAETRTGGWVSFDPKIPDDWPAIRLPYREFELQITALDPKTNQRTASLFSGTELMFTTSLPATSFSTKAQKVR